MGMIYKVYENEEFAAASRALAVTLARMPTRALAFTKHALNYSATNNFEAQLIAGGRVAAAGCKNKRLCRRRTSIPG